MVGVSGRTADKKERGERKSRGVRGGGGGRAVKRKEGKCGTTGYQLTGRSLPILMLRRNSVNYELGWASWECVCAVCVRIPPVKTKLSKIKKVFKRIADCADLEAAKSVPVDYPVPDELKGKYYICVICK